MPTRKKTTPNSDSNHLVRQALIAAAAAIIVALITAAVTLWPKQSPPNKLWVKVIDFDNRKGVKAAEISVDGVVFDSTDNQGEITFSFEDPKKPLRIRVHKEGYETSTSWVTPANIVGAQEIPLTRSPTPKPPITTPTPPGPEPSPTPKAPPKAPNSDLETERYSIKKSNEHLNKCISLYNDHKDNDAIKACNEALRYFPANAKAKTYLDQASGRLELGRIPNNPKPF